MPTESLHDGGATSLVSEHAPAVHDFLVRLTRSHQRAAELLEATFATFVVEAPDASCDRVALFRIAYDLAGPALSTAGRPRHVDAMARRAELTQVDRHRLPADIDAQRAAVEASTVWEGASSLDTQTYSLIDLLLRQDLTNPELAEVLRVGTSDTYAVATRIRQQAAQAIATQQTIRRCTRRCASLPAAILSLPPGASATELRGRVETHVQHCPTCEPVRADLPSGIHIFASLRPVALPDAVRLAAENAMVRAGTKSTRRGRGWLRRSAAVAAILGVTVLALVTAGTSDRTSEKSTRDARPSSRQTATSLGRTAPSATPDATAPDVEVVNPRDAVTYSADRHDALGWYATVTLEAIGQDDRDPVLSWRWVSDHQSGALLNQADGTTRLYAPSCGSTDHEVTVSGIDDAGNRGQAATHIVVVHAC